MSNLKINKVLILAGGYGSRLEEYTKSLPKPMVKIGSDPILLHVMRVYLKYGVNNFYIALGYKGCLLYTSPSPRDRTRSRMPSSA